MQITGTSSTSISQVKPATKADEILRSLSSIVERANTNTGRLRSVVDRAFGPSPEKSGNISPQPVPSGAHGEIEQKLSYIADMIETQAVIISDIERIV